MCGLEKLVDPYKSDSQLLIIYHFKIVIKFAVQKFIPSIIGY